MVSTDNTAPNPPLAVSVRGTQAWRSANSFSVAWRNPPQAPGSPIATAIGTLCPAAGPTSKCRRFSQQGNWITSFSNVRVPSAGVWRFSVILRDAAGNWTGANASGAVNLRYDDSPPQVALRPLDRAAPTQLHIAASDSLAPIIRGEVEVRRAGERVWRTVPTSLEPGGFVATLDDELLPAGRYDVRAHAWNAAGLERSVQNWNARQSAPLSLPLRVVTTLAAGKAKRVKTRRRAKTVLVTAPRVGYGRSVVLRGRLTNPGPNPIAYAPIEVSALEARPGASWQAVGSVVTSANGDFTFRVPPGVSRTIAFRYPGTNIERPRTVTVDVGVRGTTTLKPDRRRYVPGDVATFRGRVLGISRGGPGKIVELQARVPHGWLTFATPRANPKTGRWSVRHQFGPTSGRVRYFFRAVVPKESGWPYETGHSRIRSVIVNGG
jgi:hypothetical protein